MDKKPKCKNVLSSTHSAKNLSRYILVDWINELLSLRVQKVEELCTGAIYCQIFDMLFPDIIPMKKVKTDAKAMNDYWHNWKILQISFRTVGCDKMIPIDNLIKGKFQDNFEFLQWFKNFFDANVEDSPQAPLSAKLMALDLTETTSSKTHFPPCGTAVKRAESSKVKELKSKISEFEVHAEKIQEEKDFYFAKLRNIENFCLSEEACKMQVKEIQQQILAELYATKEGFEVPEEEN